MSKENAMRFFMVKDKDEKIKKAFDAIMRKYEGRNLSPSERTNVLQEEIIPLAKAYGYDFSPEDLTEVQKPEKGKLSEKELDEVTGGDWAFITYGKNSYTCIQWEDDDTFYRYFEMGCINDCPHFSVDISNTPVHGCGFCRWRSGTHYKY